jgi:hypothetical protein
MEFRYWRHLDSLHSAVYGTCPCSRTVRYDLEFQRVYEFLSRLRPEFEPRRAQLIDRGHVPLSVVLSKLRAEETRLCGAGLLGIPSVLVARVPTVLAAAPGPSRSSAPPLLATPSDGMGHSLSGVGRRPLRVEVALALLAFSVAIV